MPSESQSTPSSSGDQKRAYEDGGPDAIPSTNNAARAIPVGAHTGVALGCTKAS